MRILFLLAAILVLAGCGTQSSTGPASTPRSGTAQKITFKHAPPLTIDTSATYDVTLQTTDGNFTVRLLPRVAPLASNNFVFLSQHHFYDGVIFHRIIKGFVIQTGDPTGTGFGGPGYHFKDEKVTMPYNRGVVAMANSGANTNGSQFFIVVAPVRASLQPNFTIFGKVIQGMSVVQKIADSQVEPNPGTGDPNDISYPVYPVSILHAVVHERH